MAKTRDKPTGALEAGNDGLLAEEDAFDRRLLWRLGSWGVAAVGAVTLAVTANQYAQGLRAEQSAAAGLVRQAQQIQLAAKESQNETRRLTAAVDTLNSDRDRLFARITTLEVGLDSVTGAIAKPAPAAVAKSAAAAPLQPASVPSPEPPAAHTPAPALAAIALPAPAVPEKPAAADKPPVAANPKPQPAPEKSAAHDKPPTAANEKLPIMASDAGPAAAAPTAALAAIKPLASPPAAPLVAAKSIMGPPDATAAKLVAPPRPATPATAAPAPIEVAAATPADDAEPEDVAEPKAELQRTEFGVELGGANSVAGLRALWRGLVKTKANTAIHHLRPIIVIREGGNGLGMHLRLVAGPLRDAAAAAKICAALAESNRACETAVYDGQRLTLGEEPPAAPAKPVQRRHSAPKYSAPAPVSVPVEEPKKPEASNLPSLFGRKAQ